MNTPIPEPFPDLYRDLWQEVLERLPEMPVTEAAA
jgi:hypothetical protein